MKTTTDFFLPARALRRPGWSDPITRLPLETSRVGIFYFGNICSGSIKRVATAVGEGSMAVRLTFDRLRAAPEI